MAEENLIFENSKVLVEKYLQLQQEHEKTNQSLYECKNQLKLAVALQAEYQEEIKIVQSEEEVINKKWENKLQQLEEDNFRMKSSFIDNIKCLENDLSAKDEKITRLKNEIELITATNTDNNAVSADNDKLLEELAEFKQKCEELEQIIEEYQTSYETCQNKNLLLEKKLLQLQEELEASKESLNCKKEELQEANNLIQTLQDDLMCCKTTLDSMKNKPLDNESQGNSLFAEVNDRRVQLQDNMNKMKSKYLTIKHSQRDLLKKISQLQKQNVDLCTRWKTEREESKDDNNMVLDSYKFQIKTLQDLVKKYEQDLNEKMQSIVTSTSQSEMQLFDNLMNNKRQEIESLRKELKLRSLNLTLSAQNLAEMRREMWKYRLEVSVLQNEIEKLKIELEEKKLQSPTQTHEIVEELFEENNIKSIIKKENCNENSKLSVDRERRKRRETIYDLSLVTSEENKIKLETDLILVKSEKENKIKLETDFSGKKNDESNKENSRRVQFSAGTVEPTVAPARGRRGGRIISCKPVHISSFPKKAQ